MRRTSYTAHQLEADAIDLDMYRLIDRLTAFAANIPAEADKQRIMRAAWALTAARGPVRAEMHPERRRETTDA